MLLSVSWIIDGLNGHNFERGTMQGIIGFIPSCGSEKDFQKFSIGQDRF
jgi:hypothetical protein